MVRYETSIVFEGVSRWYGPIIALNDVTLRLGEGITALVGPNGAGKTTFQRLVTGQIRPSQGRLTVLGERPFANVRLAARLGCSPEHDALWDTLTGQRHMADLLVLSGFSRREARRRAGSILEQVGLGSVSGRRVGGYSKGMRQRLRIAQALAHDPDLLVFDEPLTGMDPVGRRQMADLFRRIGGRGRTIVISSHVLHEVEAITQNIVLLHRGRIVAEGDIHAIRELIDEHPHHITVECPEARRLGVVLLGKAGVTGIRLEGPERLTVETREPDAFYGTLGELAADRAFLVHRVDSPDDNLQAVFDYLVS